MIDIAFLEKKARQIRSTCVQMAYDGKVGHLGSTLSCIEGIIALYYHWLNISPSTRGDINRDRFILSKGHACSAHYAVLVDRGYIPPHLLSEYAKTNSSLSIHPCKEALNIMECSTGSLGHGLGIASGMLYGLRLKDSPARVAVLMSDGECNEGSVWEAAMFAASKKLGNLVALVDYNKIQAVGRTDEIMGHASLEEKFRSFGWGSCMVNGNDIGAVIEALDRVPFKKSMPSAIILSTKKGAGVSFMEDKVLWHYREPSADDVKNALEELGEKPIAHKEALK